MFKPVNVISISISSDEEEEVSKNAKKDAVDEVSLIPIATPTKKRKKPDHSSSDDDLVVLETNKNAPADLSSKKPNEYAMIDLLSEDEDEIVFRPATLTPKKGNKTILKNYLSHHSTKKAKISPEVQSETVLPDLISNNDDGVAEEEKENTTTKNASNSLQSNGKISDKTEVQSTEHNNNMDADHVAKQNGETVDSNMSKEDLQLKKFKDFLNVCDSKFTKELKSKLRAKKSIFLKLYKLAADFVASEEYELLLSKCWQTAENGNPSIAMKSLMKVYRALKDKRSYNSKDGDKLEHLYNLLDQCSEKIKVLETTEVDCDDEENSTYVQLQTYRAKAVKIWEKICTIENRSKYAERLTYAKLDFDRSNFPAINIAINKQYKNNNVFPTFDEMNRLIRKTVKASDLDMSESALQAEIKSCFALLGELLQRRRKMELVDCFYDFIDPNAGDPATDNAELQSTLKANKKIADTKTKEIIEKYCKIQESGCEPDVSSDSDDSNAEENESADSE